MFGGRLCQDRLDEFTVIWTEGYGKGLWIGKEDRRLGYSGKLE